jgi:hypothetical protein
MKTLDSRFRGNDERKGRGNGGEITCRASFRAERGVVAESTSGIPVN